MKDDYSQRLAALAARDCRFSVAAYEFVSDAVNYSCSHFQERRHAGADELVEGARRYAEKEYGAVAKLVLDQLEINSVRLLGEAVYALIGAGILSASSEDEKSDFDRDGWIIPPPPKYRSCAVRSMNLPFVDVD